MKITEATREIWFVTRMVAAMGFAAVLSFGMLYLLMDRQVGTDYGTAFQTISDTYQRMNLYIAMAVLAQLIVSSLLVFFMALYYSHKIAGPMYRLKTTLQRYLRGESVTRMAFRKTDFLHDLAGHFSAFMAVLEKRKVLLREARDLIAAEGPLDAEAGREKARQAKRILSRLRDSSGTAPAQADLIQTRRR